MTPQERFTYDEMTQGLASPVLGPAYFSSRRAAEAMFTGADETPFVQMVNKLGKKLRDELYDYAQNYMLSDMENNIQGHIWYAVDNTIRALLTGEKWALERYPLNPSHDGASIRATVATLAGEELQVMRIKELETAVARLEETLRYR